MQEQVKFALLVERALNSIIQTYVEEPVTRDTISAMRADLRGRLKVMFSKCQFPLSEDSVHWIADEYFKRIRFKQTDGHEVEALGATIVLLGQPDLKKLPEADVRSLASLFAVTDFGDALEEEVRRRSH